MFLYIVVLIALLGSYSHAQQRNPENDTQNTAQTQGPATHTTIVSINQAAADVAHSRGQPEHEQPNDLWQSFRNTLVDPVTYFTGLLFWTSYRQWRATSRQADLTDRAVATAEAAVIQGNRPKAIVREIDVPETRHWHERIQRSPDDSDFDVADSLRRTREFGNTDNVTYLKGSFRLTNKGSSEIQTRLIHATLWIGNTLPQTNPVFNHTIDRNLVMAGGTTERVDFPTLTVDLSERKDVLLRRSSLWALGKVVYLDKLGNARRTGFARRLNLDTGRFERIRDEDYDYED